MSQQLALDAKTAVWNVLLAGHRGRGNGIAAKPLAAAAGVSEREVRHQITALREEGIAICGEPKSGYFIAATAAELEDSIEFLKSRAMHSLVLAARMARRPLLELIGQLKLKT